MHGKRTGVLWIIELVALVVFAALPIFLSEYMVETTTRILILGLLALSFDLVWGYAGILSFGQALSFGAAAYVVAVCGRDLGKRGGHHTDDPRPEYRALKRADAAEHHG